MASSASTFRNAPRPFRTRVPGSFFERYFLGPLSGPWHWPRAAGAPALWAPVRFASPRGAGLAGLYGAAEGTPHGTVVLAHPIRAEAKGFFLRTAYPGLLRAAGFHVLLFDFEGFGESGHAGFDIRGDLLAAAAEARRRAPGLPVGVHGACLGGTAALAVIGTPDAPFDAYVVEAAPADWFDAFRRPSSRAYGLRTRLKQGLLPRGLLGAAWLARPFLRAQMRPLGRLRPSGDVRGVLLVYGREDNQLRPGTPERVCAAVSAVLGVGRVAFWEAPSTRHLQAVSADPAGYAREVVGFFERTLTAPVAA